jgi:nucleotide-binding universal stress UspA family protein
MNTHTRPVVIGADGCPGSAGAVRFAVAEAARRRAPLHLVHVLPLAPPPWPAVAAAQVAPDLREVGRSILDRAVQVVHGIDPEAEVLTSLIHGGRADGLVEASETAQLVVVGRETQRGIGRVLTGATTAAVAARARCDVVVVPSFWTGESPHGRVVAGIKPRTNAHELLSEAFEEACARGASLTLVTAWNLPDPYLDRMEVRAHAAEWEADGRQLIEHQIDEWRTAYPDVPVEIRVEHGAAPSVLQTVSRDSDLLFLSRRRHALPPHGHLGGVAHAMLRLSDVPVLVVPFAGIPLDLSDLRLEEAGAPLK